jgi:hypothetical protein
MSARCIFTSARGVVYRMWGFDADMMLAVLNDLEPFYWGS